MVTVAPCACGRSGDAAYPTITLDQQEAVRARSGATLCFSAKETQGGSTSLAMTVSYIWDTPTGGTALIPCPGATLNPKNNSHGASRGCFLI
jgi:hypothetical protein